MSLKKNDKNYIVYMHICPSDKVYIGITRKALEERCRRGKGYSGNVLFYNAINKYGWDSIRHEILFDGLSDINRELGFCVSNISACCKGRTKTARGYIWKYE